MSHLERNRRWTSFSEEKALLLQHWQSSEAQLLSEWAAIVPDSSGLLSRGQSFIHLLFFCIYHDPISFENRVSKVPERVTAGMRAFKRICPLEFNYAYCWVWLQKMLRQEFLLMLQFFAHKATSLNYGFWGEGLSSSAANWNKDTFSKMESATSTRCSLFFWNYEPSSCLSNKCRYNTLSFLLPNARRWRQAIMFLPISACMHVCLFICSVSNISLEPLDQI